MKVHPLAPVTYFKIFRRTEEFCTALVLQFSLSMFSVTLVDQEDQNIFANALSMVPTTSRM